MNQLAGKVVAITGGGTGIGAGIAKSLAEAGCKVTVGGRRLEPLQALSDQVESEHPIRAQVIDVSEPDSVKSFFAHIRENVGEVDILINSAGINIQKRTMAEMSPEDWERVLSINASGAYRCMYEVLPSMRERRDGLVVNISSVEGKRAITLRGLLR